MEALGINLGFLIAQIINFLIIFSLLGMMLWKPLTNMLDKRRETIEKGLEDARVAAEARQNAEAEVEKIKTEARTEAQKIINEARSRADELAKEVAAKAEADATNIRAEARTKSQEERNQMLAEVRGQVVSLAIAAANKLIGESMNQDKQTQIVNDFFSKAPTAVKGLGDNIVVVSALPLTDAEKKSVLKETGANNADWQVDPAILGGLVIRSGDQVIDGSVRSSLGALSQRLN